MYKCYIADMQVLQQQNLLTDEQKTIEPYPLYTLANITKNVTQLNTLPDSEHTETVRWQHQHTGESIIK